MRTLDRDKSRAATLYVNRGVTGADRAPPALRRVEALERRSDGEGRRGQLRELPAPVGTPSRDVDTVPSPRRARGGRSTASRRATTSGTRAPNAIVFRYRHTSSPSSSASTTPLAPDTAAPTCAGSARRRAARTSSSAPTRRSKGLLDVTLESVEELAARRGVLRRVRWLSRETRRRRRCSSAASSVDPPPLAQSGAVELTRWLLEQSVAITNHRYGNVHAGPKPRVADSATPTRVGPTAEPSRPSAVRGPARR